MIYKVAICDDEENFILRLYELVSEILKSTGIDYNICTFSCGEELLKYINENSDSFDLYLLDIFMKEINGMDAAKLIRSSNADTAIIFTTSSQQYVYSGYEVQALQYLLKPIDVVKLASAITTDIKRRFENRYFIFKVGGMIQKVPYDDIEYIESFLKSVKIKVKNGFYETYSKISDIENNLPAFSFCRCHRGFIINLKHVCKMNAQSIIITDGTEIPVGKTYAKAVNRVFLNYIGSNETFYK